MELTQKKIYTTEDIYALPEGQRAELIDGQMYMTAPPRAVHQRISYAIARKISNYIDHKKGDCEVFLAPFAVFLNADNKTYVEPDISVICDQSKPDEYGCNGAPDWIIEIASPTDSNRDYGIKLFKYRTAGVREYWIVNPQTRTVMVYNFEDESDTNQYTFDDEIPARIYRDLILRISDLL